MIELQPFVDALPPDEGVRVPDDSFLTYADEHLPPPVVALWRQVGLGFYGDQQLALVDPGEWLPALQAWLGPAVTSVPVAVSSFGHVYHVDSVGGVDRIQCLDPHFQSNSLIGHDIVGFFNDHLTGSDSHLADLAGPRAGARPKLGPLAPGECYYFTPSLAEGGQVSPESLDKGSGVAQLIAIHESAARLRAS